MTLSTIAELEVTEAGVPASLADATDLLAPNRGQHQAVAPLCRFFGKDRSPSCRKENRAATKRGAAMSGVNQRLPVPTTTLPAEAVLSRGRSGTPPRWSKAGITSFHDHGTAAGRGRTAAPTPATRAQQRVGCRTQLPSRAGSESQSDDVPMGSPLQTTARIHHASWNAPSNVQAVLGKGSLKP